MSNLPQTDGRSAPITLAPGMPSACQQTGCCGGSVARHAPSFATVRVNGVRISPEAIAREMQHHEASDADTAWHAAARALAIRELLLQECRRRGLHAEPETDEAGRAECEDDARIRALLDDAVMPEQPSEEECLRYYEARKERFRTPDLLEASHILIEPGDDTPEGWAQAEQKAKLILAEIGDSETAFAAAARAYSACPSAQQNGSLGQVRRGELLPVVQAVLDALPEGTVKQQPVRSPYGWHIIRLHRRIEGQNLPFKIVASKISDVLSARSWSRAATQFVLKMAAQAELEGVTID